MEKTDGFCYLIHMSLDVGLVFWKAWCILLLHHLQWSNSPPKMKINGFCYLNAQVLELLVRCSFNMIIVHGIGKNLVLFSWVYLFAYIKWKRCICLVCFSMTSIPLWLLRHVLLYWLSPRNSLASNCIYSCSRSSVCIVCYFFLMFSISCWFIHYVSTSTVPK